MEEQKTSAYSFALPLQAGAVLAGADDATVVRLGEAGRVLGIAFQLVDDLLGVFGDPARTGKSATSDLRAGKQTPLLAHARSTAEWERIRTYVGRDLADDELAEVRGLLTTSGSRRFVEELAAAHHAAARAVVEELGIAADLLADREHASRGARRRQRGRGMSLFLLAGDPRASLYDSVSEDSAAVGHPPATPARSGWRRRLLAEPVRTQVRNVYALVRVADEIVDNPDPALGLEARARMLTWLHDDVRHALQTGYSGNLVVHAFARTAVGCGIGDGARRPVLRLHAHGPRDDRRTRRASFDRYVYGSAEVVGLMCLRVFLADGAARVRRLRPARSRARAGSAPPSRSSTSCATSPRTTTPWAAATSRGSTSTPFCDADRDRILDDIAADLDAAAAVVPRPAGAAAAGRSGPRTRPSPSSPPGCGPPRRRRSGARRVRVPDPSRRACSAGALLGGLVTSCRRLADDRSRP